MNEQRTAKPKLHQSTLEELAVAVTRAKNLDQLVVNLHPSEVLQPWVIEQYSEQLCTQHGWVGSRVIGAPAAENQDPWVHRSQGMRCRTCMYYVRKVPEAPINNVVGRCRRHAPSMSGYPVVYETDWCGEHKLDEEKLR